MTLNSYVNLGKSALKVSPLCLGTMTFGEDWGEGSNVQESQKILSRYVQLGGNFIDTANVYTFGHSERIIGDFLKSGSCKRDELVLATKFFGSVYTGDPGSGGSSRKSIIAACENSLKRLQTDYIDLYWLHSWDRFTPIQETMSVLNDLVSQGKVRYIGFSDTPSWKVIEAQLIAEFRGWAPLIALQNEYSLLERSVEEDLAPMARELEMGLIPWAPLKLGILSGKFTSENRNKQGCEPKDWQGAHLNDKAYRIIDALVKIGSEVGATPGQVALTWVRQKVGVTSPIILSQTAQALESHVASLSISLNAEQMSDLNRLSANESLIPQLMPVGGTQPRAKAAISEPAHEASAAELMLKAAGQFCEAFLAGSSDSSLGATA